MAWTRKARDRERIARRLSFEQETGRRQFVSGTDDTDAETVRALWHAAVDILRPVLMLAKVDLFPDPAWGDGFESLPEAARQGWQTLHDRADASTTGIGVWVDLADTEIFEAFRAYGIESIHSLGFSDDATDFEQAKPDVVIGPLLVLRAPDFPLVYNHDQGGSLHFELTEIEHRELDAIMAARGIDPGALLGPMSSEQAYR